MGCLNSAETLKFLKDNLKVEWFPNISVILCIIITCPGTSVAAERSFSRLRNLKTHLRTTMTNKRLTGLSLLNHHLDMDIDLMQQFCKDHKDTLFKRDVLS